jgi:hypothetical protein
MFKMDKIKILTELDNVRNEIERMISVAIMGGGIPGKLLDIEKTIDKIKASITEA